MKPTWKSLTAVLAIAVLALMAAGCQKLKARDQLNKGVQAYRSAKYPEAVEFFKRAIQLDPEFPTAKLYLATAYMMQYIPGAESPENLQMAQAAHDTFLEVLKANPKDTVAIASIASSTSTRRSSTRPRSGTGSSSRSIPRTRMPSTRWASSPGPRPSR
jgi:tetratricopeptide (TPR) repeat protein